MSAGPAEMLSWLDQRADAMLRAPLMWGSYEAVELQILLLVQASAFVADPHIETQNQRRVLDAYRAHLVRHFPGSPPSSLHDLVHGDESRFVQVLSHFVRNQRQGRSRIGSRLQANLTGGVVTTNTASNTQLRAPVRVLPTGFAEAGLRFAPVQR
jgi:hypothetical protein